MPAQLSYQDLRKGKLEEQKLKEMQAQVAALSSPGTHPLAIHIPI